MQETTEVNPEHAIRHSNTAAWQDGTHKSSSMLLQMMARLFSLGSDARESAYPLIKASAIAGLHRVERSEMLTTFLLTGAWSSRAQLERLPLRLNRWQQFSNEGRRSHIKTLQDEKTKPAGDMTGPSTQETTNLKAINAIIRRLRGRNNIH